MNKFIFYSNGDPWCDAWKCLKCDTYDTYEDKNTNEVVCVECGEREKQS